MPYRSRSWLACTPTRRLILRETTAQYCSHYVATDIRGRRRLLAAREISSSSFAGSAAQPGHVDSAGVHSMLERPGQWHCLGAAGARGLSRYSTCAAFSRRWVAGAQHSNDSHRRVSRGLPSARRHCSSRNSSITSNSPASFLLASALSFVSASTSASDLLGMSTVTLVKWRYQQPAGGVLIGVTSPACPPEISRHRPTLQKKMRWWLHAANSISC